MKRNQPWALFLCGVNGAGKSSSLQVLHQKRPKLIIDPDALALSHGASAGRVALKMFDECIKSRIDFCIESTLSGASTLARMQKAKDAGFWTEMIYIKLASLAMHQERIAKRVAQGGHFIESALVAKRYAAAPKQLEAALKICDQVSIVDNSNLLKREKIYLKGRMIWTLS